MLAIQGAKLVVQVGLTGVVLGADNHEEAVARKPDVLLITGVANPLLMDAVRELVLHVIVANMRSPTSKGVTVPG
jgi:hypothetical protein